MAKANGTSTSAPEKGTPPAPQPENDVQVAIERDPYQDTLLLDGKHHSIKKLLNAAFDVLGEVPPCDDLDTAFVLIECIRKNLGDIEELLPRVYEMARAPNQSDPRDRWIKVSPDTMPEHEQPVYAWSEKLGRAHPVFFDRYKGFWLRLFDNGSTSPVDDVAYYRVGSRPPVEKGGAQ